jgi:hypothetical protein
MVVAYSCTNPTWTHADREAFADFRVLPGNVVSIDGAQADIDSWVSRNTVTPLTKEAADVAVLTAEADGIANQIVAREAEVVSLKSLQITKNADLSIAVGILEVM